MSRMIARLNCVKCLNLEHLLPRFVALLDIIALTQFM